MSDGCSRSACCRDGQAVVGQGELGAAGEGRGHRDLDAAHADPDEGADLEQLQPIVPQVAAANWVCLRAMR